ncbi:MAG: alpha/beta fold hydrolase [Pseudomonadota bacterium]
MPEKDVQITAKGHVLAGSLVLPGAETSAVCLMMHGSGPLDRNENMPGQTLDIFNTIARTLVGYGIGSLRYDKRGCGESTGNYIESGHSDLVEDAAACIDYLVTEQNVALNKIVLLGHSEGTIISAQLGSRYPGLGGLILLCPFIQNLEDVLIVQAEHLAQAADLATGVKGMFMRTLYKLIGGPVRYQKRAVRRVKQSDKRSMRIGLQKLPAQSLRELIALDSESIYRRVKIPALIVAAGKDLQCDPADAIKIDGCIGAPVRTFIIEDLTHILRKDPETHTLFTYDRIMGQPVDAEVLQILVDHFPTTFTNLTS